MPNEIRVRADFIGGMLDATLLAGVPTMSSPGLLASPNIGTTQHLPIVLDPDGVYGDPEIVHITAHATSSATATIVRGREGTVDRSHQRDTPWTHGPTALDWSGLAGVPPIVVPTMAQSYYAEATNIASTTVVGASFATVICDSEVTDLASRYDPATGIYIVPVAGVYEVEGAIRPSPDTQFNNLSVGLGIGPSNVETPDFTWRTFAIGATTNRHTVVYRRMSRFTADAQLRMFTYVDASGTFTIGARRIAIRLVAAEV